MPLATRLLLSHLIVMFVAVCSLVCVSKLSSPFLFLLHLQQLEAKGYSLNHTRSQLVKGFNEAWNRGTFLAILAGSTVAGGMSYWVSRRVTEPINQLEQVTHKFTQGQLEERLSATDIPELDRLSASFNHMAASLEGSEKRRRELIGDLTHELRTPLTVIQGYLDGITASRIEPTEDVYESMRKETKRLQRLVNDLQELSRAEAGYLPIHRVPVSLHPLLRSLMEKFSTQLLDDGPVLQLDCLPHLPHVLADFDRLEQVLVNLIGNAITYTERGSITVKAWVEKHQVWVAVVDTGQGIAPEDLPHIFERFWRSGSARKRNSMGSGIGLAISRRLIELQGGSMEVESYFGQGSTFRFWLPLA
ncbi:MAG: sensor histidine kinase [Cyanophyceae cyanobacterium]